jgi:hypothetical protein
VVVQLGKLFAGQFRAAVLALGPFIEFAADGIDPVVDAFAVVGGSQYRLEQAPHFGVGLYRHARQRPNSSGVFQ